MASKLYGALIANYKDSKAVDRILVGGEYLGEGDHEVKLTAVDTTETNDKGKVKFQFEDAGGKRFSCTTNVMSPEGTEFSFTLRLVLSMLIPDIKAYDRLIRAFDNDAARALEALTGMSGRFTLEFGKKGFIVKIDSAGQFAAWINGGKVGNDYASAKEAKDAAEAVNLKRAYLNITGVKATNAEGNLFAFNAAMDKLSSGVATTTFSAKAV